MTEISEKNEEELKERKNTVNSLFIVPYVCIFGHMKDSSKESISELFHKLGDLVQEGHFDFLSEDVIDCAMSAIKSMMNVYVDYDGAKRITGKSDSAFNSKVSRCGIPITKKRMYRYRDMEDIRNKIR